MRVWEGLGMFRKVWEDMEGFGRFGRVREHLVQNYGTVAKNNYLGEFGKTLGTFENAKSVYLSAKRATTTIPPDLAVNRFTIGILKF